MGVPSPSARAVEGVTLTPREKAQMVLLYAAILVTTIAAFAAAFAYLPPSAGPDALHGVFLFTGLGITAYVLGLRHGFDADHIAAIDNTTRKLLNDGKRPLTVGTWFSLGHSTIVSGLVVALVLATNFVYTHYAAFKSVGAVVGTLISGGFLVLIGIINLVIVLEVYRIFRGLRDRSLDETGLEDQMQKRGLLYRYFGRLFRVIETPRQVYPIGVLFGLGFDTATEVALIAISITFGTTGAVPIWAVLILPLLFTCGMVLSDTTDGFAMRYAYGWAFLKPVRKVYYNLTLTIISVLVAFVVGGVELLQVLAGEFGWTGPFWDGLQQLSFEWLGVGIVAMFVTAWLVAMGIYRWKRLEEIVPDPAGGSSPVVPG
ncbi:MAG: HoxN/HupN/NixA family nickel/cobalt transporter [Thermoplasmata archaeon]